MGWLVDGLSGLLGDCLICCWVGCLRKWLIG